MINDNLEHYREVINDAACLMSGYFQKSVHFTSVTEISEPDRRNVILRLLFDNPTRDMPQTLILKKTAVENQVIEPSQTETEAEQLTRFAHDWAGIEFLTQIGNDHAPRFYAGSIPHKYIIIEDLGYGHPSLVTPLTRAPSPLNQQEAISALTCYAKRLGRMHADTAGKFDQYSSILKRIYPQAHRFNFIPRTDSNMILDRFRKLIGDTPKNLEKDINDVLEFSQAMSEFKVFLHGDICPDNVYYKNNIMRFIDFEYADFGNALVDGVYMRMHMPSCWCSKSIPLPIVLQLEDIYRNELKKGIITAVDDTVYHRQLTFSCGYWLVRTIKQINDMGLIDHEWICPSGPIEPDSKWNPDENAFRPRIISRIEAFISISNETGHLIVLRETAVRLHAHLRKIWPDINRIDVFPVFKSEIDIIT